MLLAVLAPSLTTRCTFCPVVACPGPVRACHVIVTVYAMFLAFPDMILSCPVPAYSHLSLALPCSCAFVILIAPWPYTSCDSLCRSLSLSFSLYCHRMGSCPALFMFCARPVRGPANAFHVPPIILSFLSAFHVLAFASVTSCVALAQRAFPTPSPFMPPPLPAQPLRVLPARTCPRNGPCCQAPAFAVSAECLRLPLSWLRLACHCPARRFHGTP